LLHCTVLHLAAHLLEVTPLTAATALLEIAPKILSPSMIAAMKAKMMTAWLSSAMAIDVHVVVPLIRVVVVVGRRAAAKEEAPQCFLFPLRRELSWVLAKPQAF
jgi:hypothetical protein